MEENETFEERRKKFSDGLGLLTSSECPGKADYVKDMISGGEKDDETILDAQDIARRNIDRIRARRLQTTNTTEWARRIWNRNILTLDEQESGSCEFDRDGGM